MLFILERDMSHPDAIRGWDVMDGVVVRADNENQARQLASHAHMREGAHCWLNSELSSCLPLTQDGKTEVIIRDCNPG